MQVKVQETSKYQLTLEMDHAEARALMTLLQNGRPDEPQIFATVRETIFDTLHSQGIRP